MEVFASGVYRYGVRAVYADNEMSELTLCDSIGKNMLATLTVSAMTDTPINEIEGCSPVALFI